jgi:hypothetical protein
MFIISTDKLKLKTECFKTGTLFGAKCITDTKIMKKLILFSALVTFLFSCKQEQNSFTPKYQEILGAWNLKTISYDSAGINITKPIPYNKLLIKDNLTYTIYMDQTTSVEDGFINIVTQTKNKLELFFDAHYPIYSSYAGSHVFGFSNVELISLSNDQMILKTINAGYGVYTDKEITYNR